jgi:hypothetical protein
MDTRVRQVEDIVKNALGKAVTIVVDSEKTKLSEYDSMSKSFSGLDDRIAAAASVQQLSSSSRTRATLPTTPIRTLTPYSIVQFRDNVGQVFDDNSKVGMYVTNPDIRPPDGNGIVYFDSNKNSYTKVTGIPATNMKELYKEVLPNIGVFVVYGNMGNVSSLRPGVITKVTDGTDGTDGEKIPTEIKYLPDISNPNSIETFTNGNGGEDNLLMSSTKSMSLSQQSIDKTWLCIPPEMLPPNIEENLLRVAELSNEVEASTALAASQPQTDQKFPVTFNFVLSLTGEHRVYLVGDFNHDSNRDWANNQIEMKPSSKPYGTSKQLFTTTVELAPGEYKYKFMVNGVSTVDNTEPTTGSGNEQNNIIEVTKPVLEPAGIAIVKNYNIGFTSSLFNNKKVSIESASDDGETFVVKGETGATATISKNNLTPLMSPREVEARLVANGSKDVNSLLTGGRGGGRGRGRIRGTRKYQNQKRRGNGNGNMRRRITRKVKRSRRVGVVHRGGGGRGGKIYKKTKKHVRGGRGRGVGHRRTIKKYHRR